MNETQRKAIQQLGIGTRTLELDGVEFDVPRGIARNVSRNSWQLRFKRDGEQHGPFNFTDGNHGGTHAALEAAIDRLIEEKPVKKGGSSTGVSAKVPPVRLSQRLTLNWRISRNTRAVVAQLYSPILKKANTIYLGVANTIISPTDLEIRRLAQALIMNERVKQEDDAPFRPVSAQEMLAYRDMAQEILASRVVIDFVAQGNNL